MTDKSHDIPEELSRFFFGMPSGVGERIFHQWFDSFDDSKGYMDRLQPGEFERHRQKVLCSVEKKLQLNCSRPEDLSVGGAWSVEPVFEHGR